MNQEIHSVLRSAEGRWLTTDESKAVLDAARDYERRIAIMRSLEAKEQEVVRATVEKALRKFPRFAKERPQALEKCMRDVTIVVRYCAHAMLQRDPEVLREKLLYWFATIIRAQEFTDVAKFTYETLEEEIAKALPPNDAQAINEYVRISSQILGSP